MKGDRNYVGKKTPEEARAVSKIPCKCYRKMMIQLNVNRAAFSGDDESLVFELFCSDMVFHKVSDFVLRKRHCFRQR